MVLCTLDIVNLLRNMINRNKNRKILVVVIISAASISIGIAVGSFVLTKMQGDEKVLSDIDDHFNDFNSADKSEPVESVNQSASFRENSIDIKQASLTSSVVVKKSAKKSKTKSKLSYKTDSSLDAAVKHPWPGITELSPVTFLIDAALFKTAKSDYSPYIRGVKAYAASKEGKPYGFRLHGIGLNSALYAMGLRNGDVLISVNGHGLNSVDEAILAVSALKTALRFRIDILRFNNSISLYYRVV